MADKAEAGETPTPMTILFYSESADYFWLSNFIPHGFELDGVAGRPTTT